MLSTVLHSERAIQMYCDYAGVCQIALWIKIEASTRRQSGSRLRGTRIYEGQRREGIYYNHSLL
jgi:hypothetical protein